MVYLFFKVGGSTVKEFQALCCLECKVKMYLGSYFFFFCNQLPMFLSQALLLRRVVTLRVSLPSQKFKLKFFTQSNLTMWQGWLSCNELASRLGSVSIVLCSVALCYKNRTSIPSVVNNKLGISRGGGEQHIHLLIFPAWWKCCSISYFGQPLVFSVFVLKIIV